MGINANAYSRPAKFSTIVADADLDIGARAILTTDLSIYQGTATRWYFKNRAKTISRHIEVGTMLANDMVSSVYTEGSAGAGVTIDGLYIKDDKIQELDGIAPFVMPKAVSDNLRISHDAEAYEGNIGTTYIKKKTITFTNGIKGTLRVKFAIQVGGTTPGYARVYKNGVALGTEVSNSDGAYAGTQDEDIDVGTVAATETLELWVNGSDATTDVWVKEFRLYFDDDTGVPASANT